MGNSLYLSELLKMFRESFTGQFLSLDNFESCIRRARAKAGGMTKAQNFQKNPEPLIMSDMCSTGGNYRLFNETADLNTAPEWIPYLPKPGTYSHPRYGSIEMTAERTDSFIKNFQDRVYQEHIPLDSEHETKLSGAMAYLKDMRRNEDGSADARVEWTPRGKTLVEAGQFKYVSPEWHNEWTDPATGNAFQNVIVGGAITTRPFFKDGSLRPLVASEGRVVVFQEDAEDLPLGGDIEIIEGDDMTVTEQQFKELETKFTGISSQFAEMQTKLTEAQTVASAAETARIAAEAKAQSFAEELTKAGAAISVLNDERMNQRFTDLVLGRAAGATEGAVWFGETAAHVSMLKTLALTFGEDSEPFKSYVITNVASAAQIKTGNVFKEYGSGHGGSTQANDPIAKINGMIAEKQKAAVAAGATLKYGDAMSQVFSENPDLSQEYLAASRGNIRINE